MRLVAVLLSVTAVLLLSDTRLSAQERPNFAGSWTLIPDPDAGGGGGGRGGRGGGRGGLGQEATLVQDAATLTITRATQGGESKLVYKLDGSENKNTVAGRGGSTEQVSKAVWTGNKLVITTTLNMGGNNFEQTMALSLDAEGVLVVETTSPGRGGGDPTTRTQRYRKGA